MNKLKSKYPNINHKYLMVSQGFLFKEPTAVQTVLGSCVTVTFYHRQTGYGAIFHSLLPLAHEYLKSGEIIDTYKYVNTAIYSIARKFEKNKISINNVECKVFGGAVSISNSCLGVGERNVEAAFKSLADLRMRIVSSSVGGNHGRKLMFISNTGEVYMKFIKKYCYCNDSLQDLDISLDT